MRDVSPQRVAAEKPAPLQGSCSWHLRSGKGCRQASAQSSRPGAPPLLCSLAGEAEGWGGLRTGGCAEITWLTSFWIAWTRLRRDQKITRPFGADPTAHRIFSGSGDDLRDLGRGATHGRHQRCDPCDARIVARSPYPFLRVWEGIWSGPPPDPRVPGMVQAGSYCTLLQGGCLLFLPPVGAGILLSLWAISYTLGPSPAPRRQEGSRGVGDRPFFRTTF